MTVDCLQAKLSLSEKLGRNSVGLPNLETLVVLVAHTVEPRYYVFRCETVVGVISRVTLA